MSNAHDLVFQAGTHEDAIRLKFNDWRALVNPRAESFSVPEHTSSQATFEDRDDVGKKRSTRASKRRRAIEARERRARRRSGTSRRRRTHGGLSRLWPVSLRPRHGAHARGICPRPARRGRSRGGRRIDTRSDREHHLTKHLIRFEPRETRLHLVERKLRIDDRANHASARARERPGRRTAAWRRSCLPADEREASSRPLSAACAASRSNRGAPDCRPAAQPAQAGPWARRRQITLKRHASKQIDHDVDAGVARDRAYTRREIFMRCVDRVIQAQRLCLFKLLGRPRRPPDFAAHRMGKLHGRGAHAAANRMNQDPLAR